MFLLMLYHTLLLLALNFAVDVPTPVKALAIAAVVYGILQGAKKSPWLGPRITGWWALLLNGALTVVGFLLTVPADQLYTMNTLEAVALTVLGGAGIHGSVQNLILKSNASDNGEGALAGAQPHFDLTPVSVVSQPAPPASAPVRPKAAPLSQQRIDSLKASPPEAKLPSNGPSTRPKG